MSLNNCPKCGKPPKIYNNYDGPRGGFAQLQPNFAIGCPECRIIVEDNDFRKAKEKWNNLKGEKR